jgi:hypothetical protein
MFFLLFLNQLNYGSIRRIKAFSAYVAYGRKVVVFVDYGKMQSATGTALATWAFSMIAALK